MSKIIIFIMMMFISLNTAAQDWDTSSNLKNPVTNKTINEFIFNGFDVSEDSLKYTVKMSKTFKDMVMFESSIQLGKVRFNRWRKMLTSRVSVFLYDIHDRKIWRDSVTGMLGFTGFNNNLNTARLKCPKLYEHLMNGHGYAIISYISTTGETVKIVIPTIT